MVVDVWRKPGVWEGETSGNSLRKRRKCQLGVWFGWTRKEPWPWATWRLRRKREDKPRGGHMVVRRPTRSRPPMFRLELGGTYTYCRRNICVVCKFRHLPRLPSLLPSDQMHSSLHQDLQDRTSASIPVMSQHEARPAFRDIAASSLCIPDIQFSRDIAT